MHGGTKATPPFCQHPVSAAMPGSDTMEIQNRSTRTQAGVSFLLSDLQKPGERLP
jgi:hypothetical protein